MPKVEMYGDVDFRNHELLNAVIEEVDTDPTNSYTDKQGRIVSYEGDVFVAKTAGTGDNVGKFQYVKLATGGDATAVATEVGYIKTALGWSESTHALDNTADGLAKDVKTIQDAYASKVTVTGQDANAHTKVKVNSQGLVTEVSDLTKSDLTTLLDAGDGTYLAKTGTAAKATVLETGRTIAISGGTTAGTATSFDGSANISIPITALDASKLVVGDESAKAPIAVMPTGNAASKLLELGAVIGTNEAVIWDGSKFAGKNIASVYNVKGSVADYSALTAITTKAAGDVYNVVAANGTTPAGTNYVWTGTEWDALGGSITTSGFEQTVNKVNSATFNPTTGTYAGSDTGYPTTLAMVTALSKKADKVTVGTAVSTDKLQVVTVNSDGIVSAKRDVAAADIPTIQQSQVDGLSTALSGKQATITGAATTIAANDLTASKVLVSDGSGKVAASDVTTTTLGYLDATSSIQTQLDAKVASNSAITAVADATFLKVKYDAKGLITGSAAVTASDIPALDAAKITTGTFDVARIPDVTASKVSDFSTAADARVNAVMAAQFIEKKLNETGVTSSGNTYTITTATKAYGVMVLDSAGKQVFVDTTIGATNIVLAFGEAITPANFTVTYILKNATS